MGRLICLSYHENSQIGEQAMPVPYSPPGRMEKVGVGGWHRLPRLWSSVALLLKWIFVK
jgi:hypothetical protein